MKKAYKLNSETAKTKTDEFLANARAALENADPRKAKVSEEVSKLANAETLIPGWSILPILTCAAGVACARAGECYAVNLCALDFRKASILKGWANNTRAAFDGSWVNSVSLYLKTKRPEFFRIHVSGDFFTRDYLRAWVNIARGFPKTRFLAFSKQFRILRDFFEAGGTLPNNLTIVASAWEGQPVPADIAERLPVSLVLGESDERPACAIPCTGNCATCLGCWGLKRGGAVAFRKHG